MKIKSSADIDKSYKDAISRVPSKYKDGVMRTTDWQEKASSEEAESLWKAKIDEAAAGKRRQKAVAAVSNVDWQSKAAKLGAARIGAGMTENAGKRAKNFEPYRAHLEGMSLPAKTADPAANVANRVAPIAVELNALKKSIKG